MGLGNSTTDKDQQKTFHNREIEEEESVQDTSVELVSQTGEGGKGENAKSQGSKIQHGSRGKQQRERRDAVPGLYTWKTRRVLVAVQQGRKMGRRRWAVRQRRIQNRMRSWVRLLTCLVILNTP